MLGFFLSFFLSRVVVAVSHFFNHKLFLCKSTVFFYSRLEFQCLDRCREHVSCRPRIVHSYRFLFSFFPTYITFDEYHRIVIAFV
jgi:hypothetical protein